MTRKQKLNWVTILSAADVDMIENHRKWWFGSFRWSKTHFFLLGALFGLKCLIYIIITANRCHAQPNYHIVFLRNKGGWGTGLERPGKSCNSHRRHSNGGFVGEVATKNISCTAEACNILRCGHRMSNTIVFFNHLKNHFLQGNRYISTWTSQVLTTVFDQIETKTENRMSFGTIPLGDLLHNEFISSMFA